MHIEEGADKIMQCIFKEKTDIYLKTKENARNKCSISF